MHSLRFSDIAAILKKVPVQQFDDPLIEFLLTDSRKLQLPAQTLFFAISSPQKNANQFIGPLYQKGLRCFIVDEYFDRSGLQEMPEANIISIADVTLAMQEITSFHRHRYDLPVIGITGSNGKTIVKEWLFQLLNEKYSIVRSPKSFNSQVGVPLSVWQINNTHTLGIFEAGISTTNEMARLQRIIDPDIGIVTFMGDAHAEGFAHFKEKINEKLLLFSRSKILVIHADDDRVQQAALDFQQHINPQLQIFTWGRDPKADLNILEIEKKGNGTIIHAAYRAENVNFMIPFRDDAAIFNAITCCACMLCLGMNLTGIAVGMADLKPVEMRLELKQGINRCSIINDSYNADLDSLSIALDFLAQQQQQQRHTVVLSDFLQTGLPDDILYTKITNILNHRRLHRFIGIGPNISANASKFHPETESTFFSSTEDFLKHLHDISFHDEVILLKGARAFTFEKISRALEQKVHETVLEINLNALRHNLKVYKNVLQRDVKMMVMVKAFSYGSGSFEIAHLLQHAGVDYLAVAYADEGVELRKAGVRLPIMVMNTSEAGFDNILQYKLEPEIYSFPLLESFRHYLLQHHVTRYPVHIKLDTGMHRLGFMQQDMEELCGLLSGDHPFTISSVFSHLVASDDEKHDAFTHSQASAFSTMCEAIKAASGQSFLKHIANTSAIHRHPQYQFDMVRLGIGLYGVDSRLVLENVSTLKTTVSQVKQVATGESVGYSRQAILERDSTIATVRIGYADGYSRIFGNGRGSMLVNGQPAPVVGNVCMDMTMLDVTGMPVSDGDEVIVFGQDLPVAILAKWAGTIPYEILTNISQRVKRVYFEE